LVQYRDRALARNLPAGANRLLQAATATYPATCPGVTMLSFVDHQRDGSTIMKIRFTVALSMLAGIAVGALTVHGLYAQTKPPAYVIAEIDVIDQDGYMKEYVPVAMKALNPKFLSRGNNALSFRGEPPKRIVLFGFENMEKAKEAFTSSAYTEAWTIGSKYAKFRIFAVEGVSP
jgi:uncharacterized protein (DUF1330 family)